MTQAPGAAPFIQGYWDRKEGLSKAERPTWHPGHREAAWIAEWNRGWEEADEWVRARDKIIGE